MSNDGVTGLRSLGQRELNYKMIFIANNVEVGQNERHDAIREDDDFFGDEDDG